jgi:sortase (surface protein transpeptidase)
MAKPVSLADRVAGGLSLLSRGLMGVGVVLSILTFGPKVYEVVSDRVGTAFVQVLTRPSKSFGESLVASGDRPPAKVYQPVFDATLPTQNRLVIDAIGFDAPIGEEVADNVEETLKQGAWRVGDFGTPYARKYPTILAAHRYGYLDWSNQYRREHSFYNLPKLDKGDRVEIIWNQRNYVYEIFESAESEEITNYQADLILYTCKFLDSKTRIIKYAKLVEV